MKNKDVTKLGANIPNSLYTEFKMLSAIKYKFNHGYTKQAVIEACNLWIWKTKELDKYESELNAIGNEIYNHIESNEDRYKIIVEDAIKIFISKKKI